MEKGDFHAESWLKLRGGSSPSLALSPHSPKPDKSSGPFNPKDYLIPGWDGQALISKAGIKLRKLFQLVTEDVKKQMSSAPFNKSLKIEIYNEFLSYAEHSALECPHIESLSDFFHHLHWAKGPYAEELYGFKHTFAARVATIYLLKVRFLIKLGQTLEQKIHPNHLFNPTSHFSKTFKKGSSTQLESPAVTLNHYSWYRPGIDLLKGEFNIIDIYDQVSITELQKIFSSHNISPLEEKDYSHALSHVNFGSFLLRLLSQLPSWINHKNSDSNQRLQSLLGQNHNKVLTAQYCGDHLESLALSHWLAQNKLLDLDRKFIICPEFYNPQYRYGNYARIIHELRFLCLLTDIAKQSNQSPISLICHTYRMKENSKQIIEGQPSLFGPTVIRDQKFAYDRIVLNLTQFPKNNPHHFLMNKIQDKLPELKEGGFLLALSTKKLFIPSLSDRVEDLLKGFKLESVLTFENLKGRGEIPPYLYVLSKRKQRETQKLSLPGQLLVNSISAQKNTGIQKHPCLSFRVHGTLRTFSHFSIVNQAFKDFLYKKQSSTTPIYRKELSEDFTFEFYQDAMIDGQLINTTSKDTSRVTHPNFFKNLMRSCYPMNHFFQIEQISTGTDKSKSSVSRDLLGIHLEPENKYRHILILDYRNQSLPRLEFIPSDSFKSKLNEYGQAFCSYFGLIPKVKNTNINLFRHFFKTPLGHQILLLSLNEGFSKLRARVGALLVPKFFEESKQLPPHIEESLHIYAYSVKELLKYGPQELHKDYFQMEKLSLHLATDFPWHIMGLLVLFEQKLEMVGDEVWAHENYFENKTFIDALIKCPTQKLYPNNPEVYVELHIEKTQELHSPLERLATVKQSSVQKDMYELQLHDREGHILSLYSRKDLIKFVEFILKDASGQKISDILGHMRIPSLGDLNKLIEKQREIGETLLTIKSANQKLLATLVNQQLY